MDDWSSVHDRVSQMVRSVVGNCVVGNWMGHCMVGNRVSNCVVGNWVGNCVVGNSMMSNRVGNCMGDRVSQEANTMMSWSVVDCWQVVDSWVGHGMVGSVVNCRSSMMHNRSSMMHSRGSMVDHRGSMMHNWGGMMHKWCSVVHNWSSMVHNRGSMVHNWSSVVHSRGVMHNWSSITWSLIIDCLSSISHFLDHPISTIVVSHSLDPSIRECDSVRAGGGVAISGLLLLEVCPAVVVVDPVLVGICRRLAQVLVGQLRSWGSEAAADKGQQQGHLGGEGFGGASGKDRREKMSWIKVRGRGVIVSRENVLRIEWRKKCLVGLTIFFAELLDLLRRSPSLWRHSQAWTGAGALCGPLYTLASVSKHPLPLLPGSPFSSIILSFPLIVRAF